VNGRRAFVKLAVKVRGRRPRTLREFGDPAFEESRKEAEQALRDWLAVHKAGDAEFHRRMYELLTHRPIAKPPLPLDDLFERWSAAPRKRMRSPRYVVRAKVQLARFVKWAKGQGLAVLRDVQTEHAAAYVSKVLQGAGLAGGTLNSHVVLLRSVFKALGPEAGLAENPFALVPLQQETAVHRVPFSPEELEAVLAKLDLRLRGPALTAACTAMRRADACLLRWADVDLEAGFIVTKTAKTGEPVEVPIFPALRTALVLAKEGAAPGEEFVWPTAALWMRARPDAISSRMRRAVKNAGCVGQLDRADGKRKANLRGWHSLRTSWITTALSAGVPIELVRRVTGHTAVAVVLKHYFRPGREEFRRELEKAFPQFKAKKKPGALSRGGKVRRGAGDAGRRARPSG
jgi:integrase